MHPSFAQVRESSEVTGHDDLVKATSQIRRVEGRYNSNDFMPRDVMQATVIIS